MPQLLLELFSEEIPARMQAQAARDLERMMRDGLSAAGLVSGGMKAFAGPRRLTLVVEDLPAAQADRDEELKGPRVGAPDQAIEGFLRKTGLTREQLTQRDGVWFGRQQSAGRPTTEIVAELVEQAVRTFPWPKSMIWGEKRLRWVRPLHRILCVFDREVIPFEIEGIASGDLVQGHRFMGSGQVFRARDFDEYAQGLADHFVVLDPQERKDRILAEARSLCFARNLELVEDEGLLDEVAGLAEWPTPLLGDMDPSFLDLPAEVIRTSMRTHQKYFAVRDPATGKLAPHFLVVANIAPTDGGGLITSGNSKVLSARLSDARFFWDEDNKAGAFDAWLKKLEGVTFHAKLGTMAERVERIAALAREIAPLVGADPATAEKAARLAKADLASQMVGEFPELQGIMGRYYYRVRSGLAVVGPNSIITPSQVVGNPTAAEDVAIGDAIGDHYRPQGPGDELPGAPLGMAVALADKFDTLVGFFSADQKPTGSRDPFALRRAALGVIRIILANGKPFPLRQVIFHADEFYKPQVGGIGRSAGFEGDLLAFFADRLKVTLRDQGKRFDLVDAVFALNDDDLVRIVARVEALDGFLTTEDGRNLLAGYRRAVNILKAEEKKGSLPTGAPTAVSDPPEEAALFAALQALAPKLDTALAAEDFTAAMTALAALRAPVDAFFDKVLVNSEVAAERGNRLRLLAQVRDAMGKVADFSQIAG